MDYDLSLVAAALVLNVVTALLLLTLHCYYDYTGSRICLSCLISFLSTLICIAFLNYEKVLITTTFVLSTTALFGQSTAHTLPREGTLGPVSSLIAPASGILYILGSYISPPPSAAIPYTDLILPLAAGLVAIAALITSMGQDKCRQLTRRREENVVDDSLMAEDDNQESDNTYHSCRCQQGKSAQRMCDTLCLITIIFSFILDVMCRVTYKDGKLKLTYLEDSVTLVPLRTSLAAHHFIQVLLNVLFSVHHYLHETPNEEYAKRTTIQLGPCLDRAGHSRPSSAYNEMVGNDEGFSSVDETSVALSVNFNEESRASGDEGFRSHSEIEVEGETEPLANVKRAEHVELEIAIQCQSRTSNVIQTGNKLKKSTSLEKWKKLIDFSGPNPIHIENIFPTSS